MFNIPVTFALDLCRKDHIAPECQLDEFAAAGGKYVVLSHEMIRDIMADFRQAKYWESLLSDRGIEFCDSHSPFGNMLDLNCIDPAFRQQMILRHKLAIEIAASLGVKTITIHPGSDRFAPEVPLEQHWQLMRRGLDELLPYAEKCNIIVAIENSMSRAACPENVVMLKNEYPTRHLGLCYDSGHAHQFTAGKLFSDSTVRKCWQAVGEAEPKWDDAVLEKMLPEIVSCHLHDNNGSGDTHNLPGDGTIDWPKVITLLKKAPRLKSLQCEVKMFGRYSITQTCNCFREHGIWS